jgi:hypothetical protein
MRSAADAQLRAATALARLLAAAALAAHGADAHGGLTTTLLRNNFNQGATNRGFRGGARPPWPRDGIGFLPTSY